MEQPLIDYTRFSSAHRLRWTLARLCYVSRMKSLRCLIKDISTADLARAEKWMIRDTQKVLTSELNNGKHGSYANLVPVKTREQIWVVGKRLRKYNPTSDVPDSLQPILPSKHPYTQLLMKEAHWLSGHRGRDATHARFRQKYWTPHGARLAKSITASCQLCKLREAQFLTQEMGELPEARLKPAPPFNSTMLDFFGPYTVRGEVQRRTSGKAYGVIFTDLTSRAVHIEAVFGYDTASFIMALTKFASIRGWPQYIFSDPGSQLVGAEKELASMWKEMERSSLYKVSTTKGLTWKFGPADSPWQQGAVESLVGAVESLVKAAKRGIKFAMGGTKPSPSEFATLCYEIANMMNERPLGTMPSEDSTINILTPNTLLLGRAIAENPGNFESSTSLRHRIKLVNEVADAFWEKWTELYAPSLMMQKKWHKGTRDLSVGDVVVVKDSNALRCHHYIAKVTKVFPGADGKVRRVELSYRNFRAGSSVYECKGSTASVIRSIQRLALLVPAE